MSLSPAHTTAPTLWLDYLPPDLLTAIAHHLSASEPDLHLLHLAEASPIQAAAVCTALSHAFSASHAHARQHLPRWASIFTFRPPRALHCPHSAVRHPDHLSIRERRDRDILAALLGTVTLESASVWGSPDYVNVLRLRTNLKQLTLLQACELKGPQLWTALSEMTLQRLRLGCGCFCLDNSSCMCPFRDDGGFGGICEALCTAFGQVRVLDVNCGCFRGERIVGRDGHPVWMTLPRLKRLKGVVVRSKMLRWLEMDEDCLEGLRKSLSAVENVSIEHGEQAVEVAHVLQERMKDVRAMGWYRPLGLSQLEKLRVCQRLEALITVVDEGVERELSRLVNGWRELAHLDMAWRRVTAGRMERPEQVFWRYRAEDGLVKKIVKAGNSLRKLRLMGIGVSVEEWAEVLKWMERRLRVFGATMQGEQESAVEAMQRVEQLLYVAVRCNPELEEFEVVWGEAEGEGTVTEEERVQAERTMRAVNRLQRQVPNVNIRSVVLRLELYLRDGKRWEQYP